MAQDLLHTIALTFVPGIGDRNAKTLISYCGSVENVFKAKPSQLVKIPGIGEMTAKSIKDSSEVFERAEEELAFAEKEGLEVLTFLDKSYPERLKICADSPIVLYYKGSIPLNASRLLSIVGTRRASEYGKDICRKLVAGLKDYNVIIVSGLAYGIDYHSHKAAVENNIPTIGVLGHGLDMLYPAQHKLLTEKMVLNGGLLTEFASGTGPDKQNFPKRNRIIAGMCDATLVVETARKGGSMITAHLADAYHRDVMAVPGKTTDKFSVGCNELIKKNIAALVESAEDIAYHLGWEKQGETPAAIQQSLFVEMSEEEENIVNALKKVPTMHIDGICRQTQYSIGKVASHLLSLEFKGVVKPLPGSVYKLV